MTDRELFAQAVVALEYHTQQTRSISNTNLAIEALRARLAQPEPLPAKSKGALSHEENKQHNKMILDKFYKENAHLYTAPPQREWQGLTDEEANELTYASIAEIEAKLKEKNA